MHKFLTIIGAILVALNVQFLLLTVRTEGVPIAHNVWTAVFGIVIGFVLAIVVPLLVAVGTSSDI